MYIAVSRGEGYIGISGFAIDRFFVFFFMPKTFGFPFLSVAVSLVFPFLESRLIVFPLLILEDRSLLVYIQIIFILTPTMISWKW